MLKRVDKVKRGRGRPKLTWDESVKRDLKDWAVCPLRRGVASSEAEMICPLEGRFAALE